MENNSGKEDAAAAHAAIQDAAKPSADQIIENFPPLAAFITRQQPDEDQMRSISVGVFSSMDSLGQILRSAGSTKLDGLTKRGGSCGSLDILKSSDFLNTGLSFDNLPPLDSTSNIPPLNSTSNNTKPQTRDGQDRPPKADSTAEPATESGRSPRSADSVKIERYLKTEGRWGSGSILKSSDFLKSGLSFGNPPPLDSTIKDTSSQAHVQARPPEAAPATEADPFVAEISKSEDSSMQKLILSISRDAAAVFNAGSTTNSGSATRGNEKPASVARKTSSGGPALFTSREWGSDLGPYQEVDVRDVFRTTSEGKAEKFQASREENTAAVAGLAEQKPPPTLSFWSSQKNLPPKKKRDWNALVQKELQASITQSESQRAVGGATPADAEIFAAAAMEFGKCGAEPFQPLSRPSECSWDQRKVDRKKPPKKRGVDAIMEPQPPMEPEENGLQSQSIDEPGIFVEPTERDVLLGRGGRTNNHPGNKRYLQAKDEMQARYMAADKNGKTPISQELVDIVKRWGGRFLKMNGAGRWYEVDNLAARKKCSQTLREVNTPEVRKEKRARYSK